MGKGKARILTIIPAYNEEKSIVSTINALQKVGIDHDIVVVDDGSTDDTFEKAKSCGVTVLRNNDNIGKGGSIQSALNKFKDNSDIVLLVDADIGETAGEALKLIKPTMDDVADMTIGRLPASLKKGGFGLVRRLARKSVFMKTGVRVDSVLSGQRAIRLSALNGIVLRNGYGLEVGLTIDLLNAGYRIQEVDVGMKHIGTGKTVGGFLHRGKQFLDIINTVWIKR